MAGRISPPLTIMVLAIVLALNGLKATVGATIKGNKTSNQLLRGSLTRDKLTSDQVHDLLTTVVDKQATYVGEASVKFLLTYEEVTLNRCLALRADKQARYRFNLCNIHNLDYVPSALDYCRNRLAKQADLCALRIGEILEWSLKPMSRVEIEAVQGLTRTVLGEGEAEADKTGGGQHYSWDTIEDLAKLHFWRQPSMANKRLPVLARGCAMVVRTLGAIEPVPKYARYLGSAGLEHSEQLTEWMSALQVCRAFNSLHETINGQDKTQILLAETEFRSYDV